MVYILSKLFDYNFVTQRDFKWILKREITMVFHPMIQLFYCKSNSVSLRDLKLLTSFVLGFLDNLKIVVLILNYLQNFQI